jgi:hypothetical protein
MLSRQVLRAARAAAPQRAVTLRALPVRSFAAAASTDSQPPISVFGLDGTYASALVRHQSHRNLEDLQNRHDGAQLGPCWPRPSRPIEAHLSTRHVPSKIQSIGPV